MSLTCVPFHFYFALTPGSIPCGVERDVVAQAAQRQRHAVCICVHVLHDEPQGGVQSHHRIPPAGHGRGWSAPFSLAFLVLITLLVGLLNVNELRTLVTRIYPLPTTPTSWQAFEDILLNCSALQEPMEPLGVGVGPDGKEVCNLQVLK